MKDIHSVGIIGLGLIGGSLARDLTALGVRVRAADTDDDVLRLAMDEGVVDARLDPSRPETFDVDVAVIATPVSEALCVMVKWSELLARARVATDVCSTKRTIEDGAVRAGLAHRFIGSHPLAGDHRSGWSASRQGLFAEHTVYVCPGPDARHELLGLVHDFWSGVGAIAEVIDAYAHDRLLAWTSHLPQAASSALARALAAAGIPRSSLGPGGRDMTRLASSNADMWTAIALDNAESLSAALDSLEGELAVLRRALVRADREAVQQFFRASETGATAGHSLS